MSIDPSVQEAKHRFLSGAGVMAAVTAKLKRAAATDVRVVLYGEPGVGKSFAGKFLHRLSPRRDRPLEHLAVNTAEAAARLAAAASGGSLQGGTLLLEGVDEAPPEIQSELVGLLEEWSAAEERGEAPVRVIATCQDDLGSCVEAARFRTDLFYLLEVFPVSLPPLRRRAEDIPALIGEFARRRGMAPDTLPKLPSSFLEQALVYQWPGNLRELGNVVERALPSAGRSGWNFPLLLDSRPGGVYLPPFHEAKREFEKSYVNRMLLVTGGNVSRAAELAGKARKDFYALMARNSVDPASFREGSRA